MTHQTKNMEYTTPSLFVVECVLEAGFSLSGVEVPDFENENEL